MQRTIIAHMLLGIPGVLAIAAVMFIMKLAEVGAATNIAWGVVALSACAGLALLTIDAAVVARGVAASQRDFFKKGPDGFGDFFGDF